MATFGQIMKGLMDMMEAPIRIYGYVISFWQIFVFTVVALCSAMVIRAILNY